MGLDHDTLYLALSGVFAVISLGMFGVWNRNKSKVAFLLWGAALALRVPPMIFHAGNHGGGPSVLETLSNAMLLAAMGTSWGAARACARRRLEPVIMVLPVAVWLIFASFGSLYAELGNRTLVLSLMTGVFYLAIGYEFLLAPINSNSLRKILSGCFGAVGLQHLLCAGASVSLVMPGEASFAGQCLQDYSLLGLLLFTLVAVVAATAIYWDAHLAAVKSQASRDALTGVLNRAGFVDKACALLEERDAEPTALVLFDLDHFKQINDTFGHPAGDAALVYFARSLREHVGASGIVGRVGGEEFGLLLHRMSPASAQYMARSFCHELAETPLSFEGQTIPVKTSGGLVLVEQEGADLYDLMKSADTALYEAKRQGRNRIYVLSCAEDDLDVDWVDQMPPAASVGTDVRFA